ncbi:hypothetical protein MtrunA17_Chr3g0111341 [Medicago truncatula]|uniref:Uncharacterized protein n=1 Tax=Medicago truncatula TaxID=3880 RepID=A0A396IR37_MEDTR|nr:hypothetical protein MtrunA17_Chr3g0111341 [Medicago truncatula]
MVGFSCILILSRNRHLQEVAFEYSASCHLECSFCYRDRGKTEAIFDIRIRKMSTIIPTTLSYAFSMRPT